MEKYFEILPNTPAYNAAYNLFHYTDAWRAPEVRVKIQKETGFTNISCWPRCLTVKSPIPEHLKASFRKNPNQYGLYEAKKLSEINKKFLEIVKKYDLHYYDVFDLQVSLFENDIFEFNQGQISRYIPITFGETDRYFIQTTETINDNALNILKNHGSLQEVDVEEVVKLRKLQELHE